VITGFEKYFLLYLFILLNNKKSTVQTDLSYYLLLGNASTVALPYKFGSGTSSILKKSRFGKDLGQTLGI